MACCCGGQSCNCCPGVSLPSILNFTLAGGDCAGTYTMTEWSITNAFTECISITPQECAWFNNTGFGSCTGGGAAGDIQLLCDTATGLWRLWVFNCGQEAIFRPAPISSCDPFILQFNLVGLEWCCTDTSVVITIPL